MRSTRKEVQTKSTDCLDRVQMSESDRVMARDYMRKTEAAFDALAAAAASIRAAFSRAPAGNGMPGQRPAQRA